jgi:hypothetical protein
MDDFRFWGIVSTDGFYPLKHGEELARNRHYKSLRSVRHFNKPDEALCWVPHGFFKGLGGRKSLKPYRGRAYQYAEFWPKSWACMGYFHDGARRYVNKLKASTKRRAPNL